jgi:hypothetical protein
MASLLALSPDIYVLFKITILSYTFPRLNKEYGDRRTNNKYTETEEILPNRMDPKIVLQIIIGKGTQDQNTKELMFYLLLSSKLESSTISSSEKVEREIVHPIILTLFADVTTQKYISPILLRVLIESLV